MCVHGNIKDDVTFLLVVESYYFKEAFRVKYARFTLIIKEILPRLVGNNLSILFITFDMREKTASHLKSDEFNIFLPKNLQHVPLTLFRHFCFILNDYNNTKKQQFSFYHHVMLILNPIR